MPKYERHIFICENKRPDGHPKGCCLDRGSAPLKKLFKAELTRQGLRDSVRANSAGCLDACEHGPSIVVYPEGVWYGGVQESDVKEIVVEHIVNGRPVERLRIRDEE